MAPRGANDKSYFDTTAGSTTQCSKVGPSLHPACCRSHLRPVLRGGDGSGSGAFQVPQGRTPAQSRPLPMHCIFPGTLTSDSMLQGPPTTPPSSPQALRCPALSSRDAAEPGRAPPACVTPFLLPKDLPWACWQLRVSVPAPTKTGVHLPTNPHSPCVRRAGGPNLGSVPAVHRRVPTPGSAAKAPQR